MHNVIQNYSVFWSVKSCMMEIFEKYFKNVKNVKNVLIYSSVRNFIEI